MQVCRLSSGIAVAAAALWTHGIFAHAHAADTPKVKGPDNLQNNAVNFASLLNDLGLNTTTRSTLQQQYKDAQSSLLPGLATAEVGCITAQWLLGEAQVDLEPLNQTSVDLNWSQTCRQRPRCIIQPRDAADVSVSIRIISSAGIKFAVRSGGHSPNPGSSSIGQDGILIDLSRLRTVALSKDRSFARVGPGLRWAEVYAALDPEKTVVVGGRLPTVGVGGLLLGGGYFFVSNEVGLACDNVKNFEVVLSNGTIVNANAAGAHSDLFWALKGGGPNFGIVTGYDLYTVPDVYQVWGEILVFHPDQALDVLDAFAEWQQNGAKTDIKSHTALDISLDAVVLGLLYSSPHEISTRPAAFAPFAKLTPLQVALPPINTTFASVSQLLAVAFPATDARHDYRGASSRPDGPLTKQVYTFWRQEALAARQATGVTQSFAIQHVTDNLALLGKKRGGNPLDVPRGGLQWWTTLVSWEGSAADDEAARSVSIATSRKWKELGEPRGLHVPFLYMNDASRDQNPLGSYGRGSVARLKRVSAKYDGLQVFQRLQNGGFLLNRA